MQVQELLSLADIARLANVQRPVVSVWRSRSRGTEFPFPESARKSGSQELFASAEIVDWLAATGRGNNPEFKEDSPAYSTIARENFQEITALLTLQQSIGQSLADLSAHDILDAADELDPEDEFIYSELETAVANLESLAPYVDKLIDASYGAQPAFEALLADRFRILGTSFLNQTAISESARRLVAKCALELSATEPEFHEATAGGSDLICELVRMLDESVAMKVQLPVRSMNQTPESRLALRRLTMLASTNESIILTRPANGDSQTVHIAQFPAPGMPNDDPLAILQAIDDLVLELGAAQSAIIIAPANVLVDGLASKEASRMRDTILRMGRVRAVARLSPGHYLYKPRAAFALWVIGPEIADVPLAERRVMLADLSELNLDEQGVIADFAADLAASFMDAKLQHSHAFRFARWVRTSMILASTDGLIPHKRNIPTMRAADVSSRAKRQVEFEQALDALNSTTAARPEVRIELQPRARKEQPARRDDTSSLGDLVEQKFLLVVPGTRFSQPVLRPESDDGIKVWVAEGLQMGSPSASISYFDFTQSYGRAILTEPGDVVFTATGKRAAVLDSEGSRAVNYPLRILRINPDKPSGILPEVLAADIANTTHAKWRRWDIRRLPPDAVGDTRRALRAIDDERRAIAKRTNLLNNASQLLIRALLSEELEIVNSDTCKEGRP